MKIIYICISFLLIACFSKAQTNFTINFEQPDTVLKITPTLNNIWQIGKPAKTSFTSAYSGLNAIVTDTLLPYSINNTSSFTITLKGVDWFFGSPSTMYFYQKFNTDSLHDGGYIDVSYDGGANWRNILFDTILTQCPIGPLSDSVPSTNNCYHSTDTILGGIPAFSGNSNGWVETQISWLFCLGVKSWPPDSVMIRFNFKSDSIQSGKDGWMIDNIRFYSGECSAINKQSEFFFPSKITPNPAKKETTVLFENPENILFNLDVYSSIGELMFRKNTRENNILIPASAFAKGFYSYKLYSSNKWSTGKFVVE